MDWRRRKHNGGVRRDEAFPREMELKKLVGHLTGSPPYDFYTTPKILTGDGNNTITDVYQGNRYYQRVGQSISVRSLHVKSLMFMQGGVVSKSTNPGGYSYVGRIMIVLDRQPQAEYPEGFEVFGGNGGPDTYTSDPSTEWPNPVNRNRFVVLRDKSVSMPCPPFQVDGDNIIVGSSELRMDEYIVFPENDPLIVTYGDTELGGYGPCTGNEIIVFAGCNQYFEELGMIKPYCDFQLCFTDN